MRPSSTVSTAHAFTMPPEDDETGVSFRDELRAHLLSAATVLDYVAVSPFWDGQSVNAALLMQNTAPEKIVEQLPMFTGKQYVVEPVSEASGRLVAVRRVWRTSSTEASTSALYYAVDGTLYAAPTLAAVLRARMQRTLAHLHHALRTLARFTSFSVLDAYQWNPELSQPPPAKPGAPSEEGARDGAGAGSEPELADEDEHSAAAMLARTRYFGRDRSQVLGLLDELKRHHAVAAPVAPPTRQQAARASKKRERDDAQLAPDNDAVLQVSKRARSEKQ